MNFKIKNKIKNKIPHRFFYFFKKIYNKISNLKLKKQEWKNIEYFDTAWKKRIEIMSKMINNNDINIVDLGCGQMWLKEFINKNVHYIGVDYVKRFKDCLVCDFNKGEFPNIYADVYFLSGVLEYIEKTDIFLQKVCSNCDKIIMSYCTKDISPDINFRKNMGWKNHLSKKDLIKKMELHGFILNKTDILGSNEIFVFLKT